MAGVEDGLDLLGYPFRGLLRVILGVLLDTGRPERVSIPQIVQRPQLTGRVVEQLGDEEHVPHLGIFVVQLRMPVVLGADPLGQLNAGVQNVRARVCNEVDYERRRGALTRWLPSVLEDGLSRRAPVPCSKPGPPPGDT